MNWFFVVLITLVPLNPVGVGIVADIESQLWVGHPYADDDKVSHVHEGTHGINSRIRRLHRRPGFYLLNGKALLLDKEPEGTLAGVAKAVPPSVRGSVYNLYLVEMRGDWNEQPSFLMDELTCYTNGAIARKELGIKNRKETIQYAAELIVYTSCIAYASGDNDIQLKETLRYLIERANRLGAREYLNLSDPDCDEYIQFLRRYFGPLWTLRNFGA